MNRKRQKRILIGVGLLVGGYIFADAMGVFHTEDYVALGHGNHVHYVPKLKDDGITAANCPTSEPGENEFISAQCQLIKVVNEGGRLFYVPDGAAELPVTSFPIRPPVSKQRITTQWQLVAVD